MLIAVPADGSLRLMTPTFDRLSCLDGSWTAPIQAAALRGADARSDTTGITEQVNETER